MKTGKIFTIAFAAAALIAVLVIFLVHSRSPFGKSNSEFHSKPEKEITRIELLQDNERLTLEKSGDEWLVNGKAEARKGAINFIIRILTEARIKSPVSPEVFQKEIGDNGVTPVVVRAFEGRKTLKSFRVYKTSSNIYGNIMKIKERSKPFIVFVPGNEVNIGAAFTLRPQFWQPYNIFSLLPSEVSSIRFENVQDTSASFAIIKKEAGYSLFGNGDELTGYDPALIIRYISYFTFIPLESWVFELPEQEKERLATDNPLYTITVISAEGAKTVISLWEALKTENDNQIVDTDRLIGRFDSGNDYFNVKYFDIDPVLKKRGYFFLN